MSCRTYIVGFVALPVCNRCHVGWGQYPCNYRISRSVITCDQPSPGPRARAPIVTSSLHSARVHSTLYHYTALGYIPHHTTPRQAGGWRPVLEVTSATDLFPGVGAARDHMLHYCTMHQVQHHTPPYIIAPYAVLLYYIPWCNTIQHHT